MPYPPIVDIIMRSKLFQCDECEGRGELDYAQWPEHLPSPDKAHVAVNESVEVKREKCRLCGGTGRWTKR